MHILRPDEIVRREIIALRSILHYIAPDGTGSGNTDDVVHLLVVAVTNPDAHRYMWRVTHRPVIFKAVRSTGLGSCGSIQFERVTRTKLVVASRLIRKHAVDQKGHVRS